jgi:hypothetical protein
VTAGNLRRIERLNYLLGGILVIAAALTQPQPVALGVAVGVALTCANFFVLRRLIQKWTSDAAAGRSTSKSGLLVLPKMVGLMVAVVLSLAYLPIHPIAFAVGYSIFVVSIFVEILLAAILPSPSPTPETNEQHHG